MAVLWLSFLMAVPAAGLLFSVVDPLELQYCVDLPTLSRLGAYTIGFFLFWSLTAATGLLCVFFVHE